VNRLDIAQIMGAFPMAALAVDGAESIVAANERATALFGAELVGRALITVTRAPAVVEALAMLRQTGLRQGARLVHQDHGTEHVLILSAAQLGEGASRMALLCFEAVTEREAAAQMRRDFVANVSHELRTPLTALMGFIETLQGPARKDFAAQERFLAIMAHEAGRMNRLVQDLLSLSQVEASERQRPVERVDLAVLLASTLRGLAPVADAAKVALELEGVESAQIVAGDSDQLRQVLTNLVENAIKYGASGGRVLVRLDPVARDATLRGPAVRLLVRDFGQGIDPMHVPRLTERFYRVDNHRSREMGGTGLGLAIVKHIVNRHRGRLKIESVLGEGSTFSVILPQ